MSASAPARAAPLLLSTAQHDTGFCSNSEQQRSGAAVGAAVVGAAVITSPKTWTSAMLRYRASPGSKIQTWRALIGASHVAVSIEPSGLP